VAKPIVTKPTTSSVTGFAPRCSRRPEPMLPIMFTAAASAVSTPVAAPEMPACV